MIATSSAKQTENGRRIYSKSVKIDYQVESVTPEMAAQWLKHNPSNRPISQAHVAFLAEQIKSGEWVLNGVPIIFVGRQLIDGQHRLHAVIKSGKAAEMTIARHADSSSISAKHIFDTVDANRPRTNADILAIRGEANYKTLATLLKDLQAYYAGALTFTGHGPDAGLAVAYRGRVPNRKILELLEKYPLARESASFASKMHNMGTAIMRRSQWAALHYILSDVDEADAAVFLDALYQGTGLAANSPILALRNKLIGLNAQARGMGQNRISLYVVLGMAIRAWNAYRSGTTVSMFRVSRTDALPLPI